MIVIAKGAHCAYQLEYHFVFCPRWREQCLVNKLAYNVYQAILKQCRNNDFRVVQLNVQEDHVHLCVCIPPSVSLSDAIGLIKSGSSYALAHNVWGKRGWSRGYFVSSIGVDDEIVKRYINTQSR